MFAPNVGVMDDPATGSANGCLAAYLVKHSYLGKQEVEARVEQENQIGKAIASVSQGSASTAES